MRPIRHIILAAALAMTMPVVAQEPAQEPVQAPAQESAQTVTPEPKPSLRIFDEMEPNVTVYQSENVNRLLTTRVLGVEADEITTGRGFRIQFFSSNDPKTAAAESSKVAEQLRSLSLGYDIYRTYNAPFWRVRVGDFQTQEEANEVLEELLEIVAKQKPELLEQGSVYTTHDDEVVLVK
ncbi:MAG: SPOR domain-containing protein [Paludibacteraceae bacterium]|nr:SPOR domain-containing protein [Paludibacteraceae bacterium]